MNATSMTPWGGVQSQNGIHKPTIVTQGKSSVKEKISPARPRNEKAPLGKGRRLRLRAHGHVGGAAEDGSCARNFLSAFSTWSSASLRTVSSTASRSAFKARSA